MREKSRRLGIIAVLAGLACSSLLAISKLDHTSSSPENSSCMYDIQDQGELIRPPAELMGVRLLELERSVAIRHSSDTGPPPAILMIGRGQVSRSRGTLYEDGKSTTLLATYASGDDAGRRVVTTVIARNSSIISLDKPSYTLALKKPRPGCAPKVEVYAEDPSAISRSAIIHSEMCDVRKPIGCGVQAPSFLSLTCGMRSSYPKGRALYMSTSNGERTATLVDWSTMTNWRLDPSTYQPHHEMACSNPFSD
jgi:hypothetical protein